MLFSQTITTIITQRTSIRTYEKCALDAAKETALNEFLASQSSGPLQSTTLRFRLIAAKPGDTDTLKHLKTYGTIKNPAGFIVGVMTDSPHAKAEDFGYAMELSILRTTDLQIGTCWLGGSLRKSGFANAIGLQEHETIPAVTSIGLIPAKLTFKDKFIRNSVKADKRLPWNNLFFDENFDVPLSQPKVGAYAQALEMVRLGPSASNKQPWRIVKASDRPTFHFYLRRNPQYTKQLNWLKAADLQRMDIGIAMCHFELTANEHGLRGTWQVADPNIAPLPDSTEYIVTWQDVNE